MRITSFVYQLRLSGKQPQHLTHQENDGVFLGGMNFQVLTA